MRRLTLILILSCLFMVGNSQQRHALVVGINEYESVEGGARVPNLKGCVNDAKAIRGLLVTRFGYKYGDIDTLFNKNASKANILAAFRRLYEKAKPNDVVFFFYAGHGLSFKNSGAQKDEKTSEGILATDISSPASTVLFDWELSAIYNRFIAKGCILTVMLDCCHSGNMLENLMDFGPYVVRQEDLMEKNNERSVAAEKIWGSREENFDSLFAVMKDDPSSAVFGVSPGDSNWVQVMPKLTMKTNFQKDSAGNLFIDSLSPTSDERFIPFTDQDMKRANTVARPHEKKNGRVLFLAAAQGHQLAKEKGDGLGVRQGNFTRAVLLAYSSGSANMPVAELQRRIAESFAKQGVSSQSQLPNYLMDETRKQRNLLGVNLPGITDKQWVGVKGINKNMVMLSSGRTEGLAPGYVLAGEKQPALRLQVKELVGENEAMAQVVNGTLAEAKNETRLLVTSRKRSVPPALRIYLPKNFWTMAEIGKLDAQLRATDFFKKNMLRYPNQWEATDFLLYDNRMLSYGNNNSGFKPANPLTLFTSLGASTSNQAEPTKAFVFMPIALELMNAIRKGLGSNPNVVFVDSEAKANFSLYAAYNDKGKLTVAFSDELIKYRQKLQQTVKAERNGIELESPFQPAGVAKDADRIIQAINGMAAKFRWLE